MAATADNVSGRDLSVPFVVRGRLIEGRAVCFESRNRGSGTACFWTPDPTAHVKAAVDHDTQDLVDLYAIPSREIAGLLHEVGLAFVPGSKQNARFADLIEQAIVGTAQVSNLTERQIRASYAQIPYIFNRDIVTHTLEREVGIPFLDGWVDVKGPSSAPAAQLPLVADGGAAAATIQRAQVRAFGARMCHILAGNVPLVAALSIMRAAAVKGASLFKLPSNDPFTASAILRVMAELFPGHPLPMQMSTLYWRGGDKAVEDFLYRPFYFSKIVAWGGRKGIEHVLRRGTVGIELITFDPKLSVSLVGREAFSGEDARAAAVALVAEDILAFNQEACVSSRYQFVEGTEEQVAGFCDALYERIRHHAEALEPNPYYPRELKTVLNDLEISGVARVWGGKDDHGAVVLTDEPLDEAELFPVARTASVIRVDNLREALPYINVATQTIGVYPEERKASIRDAVIARGGQRVVSLGGAARGGVGLPHDGFYPCHRMVRWVVDEA